MRLRSTTAASVLAAAALTLGVPGTASAADRDCPDFPSQAAAQAALDAVPGDPERLDRDGDGIACEETDYSASVPAPGTASSTRAPAAQVATRPVGAVAAGDGSSAPDGSVLPYVLGGLALAGAGGAAVAARRTSRSAG